MIRIAALDDELQCLKQIKRITEESMFVLGIKYQLAEYIRPKDLFDDLDENKYFDIYLLDIEMSEYTGIEVAQKIREKFYEPTIIYITNYIEYAVQGYEVNAYRYIAKVTLEEKLPEAYQALGNLLEKRDKAFYTIEKSYSLERIPYQELYYLKKDGKYVLLVHKRGQSRVRKTLEEVVSELMEYGYFLIIDRSYVVNMMHIMSLKGQQIFVRDGSVLPVSQPRLENVKKEIAKYWR